VCTGDACLEKHAKKLRKRLKQAVADQGLEDDVKVKKCGCLKRCGKAPVIAVKPGGALRDSVKPKEAEDVLKWALKEAGRK
jgi:bidirectional [NiFe] hydrogenase diaphorase subunit